MILAMSLPISFDRPEWLWLLLAIPVIVAVSVRSLAGLDLPRRIVAVTLRSAVILVLALALAGIEFVKVNDNVAVMFVLDKSRSIPDDLRIAAEDYIKKTVADAEGKHRAGVISFDGQADIDVIPSGVGFDIEGFSTQGEPDRTNIATGLRMALAAFPEGYARRVVLLTDGNENVGDLTDEIETAVANQVAVDIVPLEYEHKNEIFFDRISVPTQASKDTKIPVRLILKSQRPARAKLDLYHNDVKLPLADPVLKLAGGMKPDRFDIPIELRTGGVHRFDARITALDENDDSIVQNNRATAFTFVDDQGKVLILTKVDSQDDEMLHKALLRENFVIDKFTPDQLHIDLLKLQEYSTVILCNISADTFNQTQHKAMASYVRDFSGGLVMTGGDEGFGAGGWIGTPLEEVSPVWFEVKHKKIIPKGALVIIMHSCEIPKGNYWGEQVATAAVKTISSRDYLGIICYSWKVRGVNWDVPLKPATNKNAIIQKIKQMQIGDMPDFNTSLNMAIKGLMGLKDVSQRHIIIISDGDPSPPNAALIQSMVTNSITCSTVGIGYGVHVRPDRLIPIAKQTKGRFYSVKNPRRLPQIFMKEAKVVKRPLIDDRQFQPALLSTLAQTTLGLRQEEIPPLGGLVLTSPKPECTMPIARKTTDGTDPVLAHWNYEMGKMAVFTSGWWPKWGTQWTAWPKFGKFWAQLIRWTMRQQGSADFDVITRLEGNKARVVIEALNKDASYLNFLQIAGRLVDPSAEPKPLYLNQTGPGRYETTFDVDQNGNYLISLEYKDPKEGTGTIRTGLSMPYSQEFRELQTNMPLLNKIVEQTPKSRMLTMNPETDQVFSKDLPPSISRQPIWQWVVKWLLLPLFLLDVAGRRLASALAMSVYVELAVIAFVCALLYAAKAPPWMYVLALILGEAVGWAIRWRSIIPTIKFFTHTVAALKRVGQRSAQSLSQLKTVREKVREDLDIGETAQEKPTTIELEPQTDSRARFDVGDEMAAKPARDVTESLGEAAATEIEPSAKPTERRPAKGPGDLAERLRKAKKRAQDAMKEHEEKE